MKLRFLLQAFPGVIRVFGWLLLAFVAGLHGGAATALDPKLLAEFAKDGLPDARGAKWVRAIGEWGSPEATLPGYCSGNAWLVREEPDGTVELIVNLTRRVRAHRVESKSWELLPAGLTPREVEIIPADLTKDVAEIAQGLEKLRHAVDPGWRDYRREAPPLVLLFLAQLQRRGETALVRTLLPKLRAFDRQLPVDRAAARLADARLLEADTEWAKSGNAKAYAAHLQALAARFPKHWPARPSAASIRLIRSQKPPVDPPRNPKEAAALALFALRPEHLVQLPVGINWLIPAADSFGHSTDYAALGLDSFGDPPPTRNALPWWEDEDNGIQDDPRMKSSDPTFDPIIRRFFLHHASSAAALADLLDDHRVLRILQTGRPYEMGEMAAMLLRGLRPGRRSFDAPAPKAQDLRVWVKSLAAMDDGQVATAYLRSGSREKDVLTYAAGHPTPENLGLLRRIFLDGEFWRDRFSMFYDWQESLRRYVKTLGPDRPAFARDLLALLQPKEVGEASEYLGDEAFSEVKLILDPPDLSGLLTELGAADEEQVNKLMHRLFLVIGPRLDEATEARILQATAGAQTVAGKGALLAFFNPNGWGDERYDLQQGVRYLGTSFSQPKAQRALATLLYDQTPLSQVDAMTGESITVAEVVVNGVLLTRGRESPQAVMWWSEFQQREPKIAAAWLLTLTEAITTGRPIPPLPKEAMEAAGGAVIGDEDRAK